jgi:hypothetical protein
MPYQHEDRPRRALRLAAVAANSGCGVEGLLMDWGLTYTGLSVGIHIAQHAVGSMLTMRPAGRNEL